MKTRIFFRTYKYEVFALFFNILLFLVANSFIDLVRAAIITIFVLVFSTILVIYLRTRDRDFYLLPMDKPGQEKDWVGRGDFDYIRNEKCYEITNSHVGYIFPKISNWDDYFFQFKFKIINKTSGWIVRAVNLSNYIMLQCDFGGINPHIRIEGEWVVFEKQTSGLTFIKELNPDTWYGAKIICEKRSIRILILENNQTICDRHWKIPEVLVVKYRNKKGGEDLNIFRNIDFDFGAIGFRNHGDERAFIKEVFVEKL